MLVFAFFILLPAATLALYPCNKTIMDNFFKVLDYNQDGGVNKTEAFKLFNLLDSDGNGKVSLAEVKAKSPEIAPELVGDEEYVFNILDVLKNGVITEFEIVIDFIVIDRNNDGVKSKKEWDRFVTRFCPIINPNRPKSGCANLLCGLLGTKD